MLSKPWVVGCPLDERFHGLLAGEYDYPNWWLAWQSRRLRTYQLLHIMKTSFHPTKIDALIIWPAGIRASCTFNKPRSTVMSFCLVALENYMFRTRPCVCEENGRLEELHFLLESKAKQMYLGRWLSSPEMVVPLHGLSGSQASVTVYVHVYRPISLGWPLPVSVMKSDEASLPDRHDLEWMTRVEISSVRQHFLS